MLWHRGQEAMDGAAIAIFEDQQEARKHPSYAISISSDYSP
jgi:hypothetical protein